MLFGSLFSIDSKKESFLNTSNPAWYWIFCRKMPQEAYRRFADVETKGIYIKRIHTRKHISKYCGTKKLHQRLEKWTNFATVTGRTEDLSQLMSVCVCVCMCVSVFESVPSRPESAGNFLEMQSLTALPRGRPNKPQMCSRICPPPPLSASTSKDYRNTWEWRREG